MESQRGSPGSRPVISPLTHRRIRRSVGPYIDGELAPGDRAELARHLAECWRCNTLAETLALMKRALRARAGRAPANMGELRLRRLAETLAGLRSPDGAAS